MCNVQKKDLTSSQQFPAGTKQVIGDDNCSDGDSRVYPWFTVPILDIYLG